MWNSFDNLIPNDVDFNHNVHLLYPVDDAGEMERWALGTVPKNGSSFFYIDILQRSSKQASKQKHTKNYGHLQLTTTNLTQSIKTQCRPTSVCAKYMAYKK